MSQVQTPGVQESSSRPTTQNSIQSSNPSLLKTNNETSYQTSFFNKDDYAFFRSEESSADIINELENSKTEVLDFDQLSPLHDFKQSTNIQLSSGLEFLNEIPTSCVEFAYKKISSELCTGVSAFANSEYTSSSKLTPCTIKYEDFSPTTKNSYHRKFAIEEIIETEETYISSLKMLSGIYLGSLITKGSDGVPIKLLHSYIESLITNHQSFLKDLRSLFYFYLKPSIRNNLSPGLRTRAEELLSCSSPLMAALVSQLIAEKAISLYFYQELSCLHELVLRLMAAKESDPEFGSTLTKGYQLFLEATQGSNSRMDLSFSSLIQKV